MARIFYGFITLILLFQATCFSVFAEGKGEIKVTDIGVTVQNTDSYIYKFNCTDNNNTDMAEIQVNSPHGNEWKVNWNKYHEIEGEIPYYELEKIDYGKTNGGGNTVNIKKATVYPVELITQIDSDLWEQIISGKAFNDKPDIFKKTTIKGREALIVGTYEYDDTLFDYGQNTSGEIRVNAELGVTLQFEVFFKIHEFDSIGNFFMRRRGYVYSTYELPDVYTKDQSEKLDVIPVDEIMVGLKSDVDNYIQKGLQIAENTEFDVHKVPFSDGAEYKQSEQGKQGSLIFIGIPGPNNTVQGIIGMVVPGLGIIILGALGTGISPTPIPDPIIGPTGVRDGTERTLKGKTDGREYNIKYNAEKDEWTNIETGNIFYPERFEGWQNDLARDRELSSKELEKMSNRETEFDKYIKRSVEEDKERAELLKRLHSLRKNLNLGRTEASRINRPSGEPGSMTDKINELEKQLINGEAVDKELLRKVKRVYSKAANGDIAGYDDLPNISLGKDIGNAIELTGKEILSGSSTKALVLRGLLAVASGGATEMGMEIISAGFVIKDYVDKGGDSVVEGMILGMGNAIISEGAGKVTGKYVKTLSKYSSKAFHNLGATSKEGYKIFKAVNNAKNAKFNIKGKEISIGLNNKMIDNILENTGETGKNIFVAPPFQNIYKSMFIK